MSKFFHPRWGYFVRRLTRVELRLRLRRFGLLAMACATLAACSGESARPNSDSSAGVTGGDFHSLVADPLVADRLYVGGHSAAARSDDGGATWTPVAALDSADAMGWAISPEEIWVSGHAGLNLSVDGGLTFAQQNAALPDSDVHAFGAAAGTLFAAGPGTGVAASVDSGRTWTIISSDAGQAFFGRIVVDPADPARLLAADIQKGVSRSDDGGRTWTPLGSDPATWVSSVDGLATIYASGTMPQRSTDGGATWSALDVPDGASLVEASGGGTLYAGVHDGEAVTVWSSADEGATWTRP